MITIVGLWTYPIKSCRGIKVRDVDVCAWGFKEDHRFMLVDEGGQHLSQRECPDMCKIQVSLVSGVLIVDAPDMSRFSTPFVGVGNERWRMVSVHNKFIEAFDQGKKASDWFSTYLGRHCSLVRADERYMRWREVDTAKGQTEMALAFQDSSPIHLLTTASLKELSGKSGEAIPIDRFRPNILVHSDELTPHAEDTWGNVLVRTSPRSSQFATCFVTRKKTERCGIPAIDQQTGEKCREPLATLAEYRQFSEGENRKIYFGTYLIPTGIGELVVGQQLIPNPEG